MAKPLVDQNQVIRRGVSLWDVNRVTTLFDNTLEYEPVGRVARVGKFFYIELPVWLDEGYKWERQPRGYLLLQGAVRALLEKAKVKQ